MREARSGNINCKSGIQGGKIKTLSFPFGQFTVKLIRKDKILKKQISNYKSAISALSEFVAREDDTTETKLSLLPVVELPFESVYDQKALIKKFNSRLITQERYYYGDNASFSARVISSRANFPLLLYLQ